MVIRDQITKLVSGPRVSRDWEPLVYVTKQLLNDSLVYIEKYFLEFWNINLAA